MRKITTVAAAAAALMALAVPTASAQTGDPAGCTTVLVDTLTNGALPELVEVTYTPPGTVTVDADGVFAAAQPFVTWVDCVV
ncbi:MAG TPA: hypothetical protein VEV43_12370 [Actinomycetota bacterium]|nr:hypothetical protein [Actinomycetota bacterium]